MCSEWGRGVKRSGEGVVGLHGCKAARLRGLKGPHLSDSCLRLVDLLAKLLKHRRDALVQHLISGWRWEVAMDRPGFSRMDMILETTQDTSLNHRWYRYS